MSEWHANLLLFFKSLYSKVVYNFRLYFDEYQTFTVQWLLDSFTPKKICHKHTHKITEKKFSQSQTSQLVLQCNAKVVYATSTTTAKALTTRRTVPFENSAVTHLVKKTPHTTRSLITMFTRAVTVTFPGWLECSPSSVSLISNLILYPELVHIKF